MGDADHPRRTGTRRLDGFSQRNFKGDADHPRRTGTRRLDMPKASLWEIFADFNSDLSEEVFFYL